MINQIYWDIYPEKFPYKLDFYDARTTNFSVYYISVCTSVSIIISSNLLKIPSDDVTEGNNKTILMRETFDHWIKLLFLLYPLHLTIRDLFVSLLHRSRESHFDLLNAFIWPKLKHNLEAFQSIKKI